MVFIKKINGEYFLVRRKRGISHETKEEYTNIFPIRATSYKKGGRFGCFVGNTRWTISTPDELVGKKVKLKVVICE